MDSWRQQQQCTRGGWKSLHTVRFRPLTLGLLFSVVCIGEDNGPRSMMYIALTYDHRLIYGREVRQSLLGN
jgi:pyruvate/2-oxoglutarate dehydrogenase complex dihydrolipoamide acyltransferase (E2) component